MPALFGCSACGQEVGQAGRGVTHSTLSEQIRRAFRNLVSKHHPDKPGGDAERFR